MTTKTLAHRDPLTGMIDDERDEFDRPIYDREPGGLPPAPEGSADRLRDDAQASVQAGGSDFSTSSDAPESEPLMVTDYGPDGEARDYPVEERDEDDDEPLMLRSAEMWDGKEVAGHRLKFSGAAQVGRTNPTDAALWESAKAGRRGWLYVAGTYKKASFEPTSGRDEIIKSIDLVRSFKIDSISADRSGLYDERVDRALGEARDELGTARAALWAAGDTARTTADALAKISDERVDGETWDILQLAIADLRALALKHGASGSEQLAFPDAGDDEDFDAADDMDEEAPRSKLDAALAEAGV